MIIMIYYQVQYFKYSKRPLSVNAPLLPQPSSKEYSQRVLRCLIFSTSRFSYLIVPSSSAINFIFKLAILQAIHQMQNFRFQSAPKMPHPHLPVYTSVMLLFIDELFAAKSPMYILWIYLLMNFGLYCIDFFSIPLVKSVASTATTQLR